MPAIKSTGLARLLDVSDSTIRNWSTVYGEFLSEMGQGITPGASRRFDDDDQAVLATVAHFRARGVPRDEIMRTLAEGVRIERMPEPPTPEEIEARKKVELVPRSQVRELQRTLIRLEKDIERLRADRDDRTREIADLREEIGRLKARRGGLFSKKR